MIKVNNETREYNISVGTGGLGGPTFFAKLDLTITDITAPERVQPPPFFLQQT